jgi:hypothetical protein
MPLETKAKKSIHFDPGLKCALEPSGETEADRFARDENADWTFGGV